MRAAAFALLLVSLTGCGIDRLQGSSSELRAAPDTVTWTRGFVGYSSEQTLTIENAGRADRQVRLSISGPFTLSSDTVTIAGGESIALPVSFSPVSAGHFDGALKLESEGFSETIALVADAETPPACDDALPCHVLTFDPIQGACVDALLPDDGACTSPCIDEGTCHDGECLGASPTCDDGNACTQDACDVIEGCVHLDASSACAAPPEPCKVAFCDPVAGCGVTDAVDGTSCGAADCITADVCLSGVCKTVPVPEGATCAPSSPCQSAGTCHQQQCVVPAPTPMTPAWSYQASAAQMILFTGTLDAQNNLYWVECATEACELVSFSYDGIERFRASLRATIPGGAMARGALMVVGQSVLVATWNTVQSFRISDGVEEWFTELPPHLIPGAPTTSRLQLGPLVDLGQGRVAVRAYRIEFDPEIPSDYASWIVALSTSTGHVDWSWKLQGYADGLVAQADGSTWFIDYPIVSTGQLPQLVSLTRDGVARINQPSPAGKPLATFGDRLVIWSGQLVSTLDGTKVADIWTAGGGYIYTIDPVTPLLGEDVAYLVGNDWGRDIADVAYPGAFVRRFDPITGEELWATRLDLLGTPSPTYGTQTSQPALLSNQSVLVARGDAAGREPWQLFEITKEGEPAWVCDLPGTEQFGYATVIGGERLFTTTVFNGVVATWTVEAFDVPGLTLASKGWTVLGGTPQGGGRPR